MQALKAQDRDAFVAAEMAEREMAGLPPFGRLAAVIASQALISGAYSLTMQAIQLGYFPRLKINYTNAENSGQIYIPFVNFLLAVGANATEQNG